MNLELKKIEIDSFKGCKDVLLELEGTHNVVTARGDGAVGKTSFLEAIFYAIGGNLNLPIENYINKDSAELKLGIEFDYDGDTYRIRTTNSQFLVEKLRTADGKWSKEASPKSFLEAIFKKAYIPSGLYEMENKKQLEWLLKIFPLKKSESDAIKEIDAKIKELSTITRPAKWRELKDAQGALVSHPIKELLKINSFAEELEQAKVKANTKVDLQDLQIKNQQHLDAVQKLSNLDFEQMLVSDEVKKIEQDIIDLQTQLELKKTKLTDIEKRIEIGNKFVADTLCNKEAYDNAFETEKEIQNAKAFVAEYDSYIAMQKKVDTLQEEYNLIDSHIVNSKKSLTEIKADCLPKIPNLEIVPDEYGDKPLGLYVDEISLNLVNESKFIETIIAIMVKAGSRFVFIENINRLGSNAIESLNKLAKKIKKDGGFIFASEMERGNDTLTISLDSKM